MSSNKQISAVPVQGSQENRDGVSRSNEAEMRLAKSEARYRRLFETAEDGILILNGEGGQIDDANPFLTNFLGYSREELLGKELWEIGFFKDIEANREAFKILKEKGYIRYENLPLKTKEGNSLDVEFVSNTYDVDGQKVIQCNIRDITERRRTERALETSETALRQSKKLEAMGKLAGGIAHDFNNVLTAINGYTSLALSMVQPGEVLHDHLDEILKAGERATSLTRQLLAFSRQQILAPKVLRLNSIVFDMHGMLIRLIGESLSIRKDLEPGLWRVKADSVQMQQLLMNLVINARDAMSLGGEITVSTRNVDLDGEYAAQYPNVEPGKYVMLSVRDAGAGMTEEVKSRIFDPYFTTKQLGKGSGMGLATVHGIVEQSNGHITVESSQGKGSIFRIYLPRTEQEEETLAIVPVDSSVGRGSETVLLAEDEEMVRKFIKKVLESFGYNVLEAQNGVAALALSNAHEGHIDLLLTDLMMPNMNGRELAKIFTSIRPDCHVLFMSGYTDDIVAQQNLIEEGVHFIQKPFSPNQLVMALREAMNGGVLKTG